MSKKNYLIFLVALLALTGCKKNNNANNSSSNSTISDSSSSSIDEGDGSYEPYNVVFNMNASSTTVVPSYDYSGIYLEGESTAYIEEFLLNPFRYEVNDRTNTLTIHICGENYYSENIIVYTPDWHFRTTLARTDSVTEYVILKDADNQLYVSEIFNSGATIIPVNGFVISIPGTISKRFSLNDKIKVNFTYNEYKSAIYNQDGERICFEYINDNYFYWNYNAFKTPTPGFFDTNADSNVIQYQNTPVVSITFDYDSNNQSYKATNFSKNTSANKQFMDINDGFALIMDENQPTAIKLDKGVAVDENDEIFFETVPGYFDETITFNTNGINTINNCEFTIAVNNNQSSKPNYGEWSYEIAVVNNIIVDRAVTLDVPNNGYVLTIKAANQTTIESLVKPVLDLFTIGASVGIVGNSVVIDYDCLNLSTYFIEDINNKIDNAIAKREVELYDIDVSYAKAAKEAIKDISDELTIIKNNVERTETLNYRYYNLINQIDNLYEAVYSSTFSTETVNMHSVWHYPVETDLNQIRATLDNFVENNINEVFIDILSNGYTYYKSDLLDTYETVRNCVYGDYKDYLEAFVTEAHERGLKVQAIGGQWMQHQGVVEKYPEFANYYALNVKGEVQQDTLDGLAQYLDPANYEVSSFYLELYEEVLKNYDVDGLHLDGIRYGASNDNLSQSQGITEAARERFNDFLADKGSGLYFNDLDSFRKGLENSSTFEQFNEFRRSVVTEFVSECASLAREYNKKITAAVVAGLNYARSAKLQAWDEWADLNIMDGIYLMSYYIDGGYVEKTVAEAVEACKNNTYVVGGIAPIYLGIPGIQVSEQIIAANIEGSVGSSIFAGHSFGVRPDISKYLNSETGGVYSQQTIVVYEKLSLTMQAIKESLLNRSENIYQVANAQTSSQFTSLENDLNNLISLISAEDSLSEANQVLTKLNEMLNKVDNYGSGKAVERITETLEYAKHIVELKISSLS